MFALFSRGAAALLAFALAGPVLPPVPGRASWRSTNDVERARAVRDYLAADPAVGAFIAARFPATVEAEPGPFRETVLVGALERAGAELGLTMRGHTDYGTRLVVDAFVRENDVSRSPLDFGAMRSFSVELEAHLVADDGTVLAHAAATRAMLGISLSHAAQHALDGAARTLLHALVEDIELRVKGPRLP